MILSSRQSPRITLRRGSSYTTDKAPLSSTSSRFSFNHLIASPPPSPSLPALVPRHGRPLPSATPRRYVRLLFWLTGVFAILYFGYTHIKLSHSVPTMGWMQQDDKEYEMVGEDRLPDFPTPVVASDRRGRAKWTVSIPPSYDFPLDPEAYSEICRQNMEASNHVADLHNHKHVAHGHYGYYHVDPYFIDVAEAVEHGMLHWDTSKLGSVGSMVGEREDSLVTKEVCNKSMTFAMETSNAGLGDTLMMLWTAYGLAQKEGRAFFVDDSRWAYGKYTDYFQPPPLPSCLPPPRNQILPCPNHARHIIVSAATVTWTFGGKFNEEFEDGHKMEVYRKKPMFNMARAGYEALFKLKDSDIAYVDDRIEELTNKTMPTAGEEDKGLVVGIHVRHGDRHPMEFQYSDSYIPLEKYSETAHNILHTKFNDSGLTGEENRMAELRSVMVLASDDPEVYASDEFSLASRAQDQIRLASKGVGGQREDIEGSMFKRFIDETVGWGGGFFAGMFWSLGRSSESPAAIVEPPDTKLPATVEVHRLRELVGRAYLMDLAVLGGVSDVVVCGVSAMGCKLLAVMMGWEQAIEKNSWVNVDGQFEWKGVSW